MPKSFSYNIYKSCKKIMVTNYSSKKCILEHYAPSDEFDVLFKRLPPVLENGHL